MSEAGRPSVEELDQLSTEQLRRQAFDRAEKRRDVGFFWDLIKHLEPSHDLAREDGSAGHLTGGIADAVEIVRELMGGDDLGDSEPLIRARFIDYLRS
ncbi:MAG: hypothetical protein QOC82_14 [Frankiaceae bacterium]|jgi:hypothetical protein|nr:hypothetical protein [Frankiaceae bacterium]MDQ1698872.1 hypothetical protein [Frankiaceae bacterium]